MTEFRTPFKIKPVSRLPARKLISAQVLRTLAGPWKDPSGEALIVLTGDSIDDDFLGRSSYWRAVYAVLAWRQGVAGPVLISGGSPGAPLAGQMRNFLIHSGVPAERIETDLNSKNTRESVPQCAARLRGIAEAKVLLTSDYHMRRAAPDSRRPQEVHADRRTLVGVPLPGERGGARNLFPRRRGRPKTSTDRAAR